MAPRGRSMQFTVQKADLLRDLRLVQGVVEKKATIPILSKLLLHATRESRAWIVTAPAEPT